MLPPKVRAASASWPLLDPSMPFGPVIDGTAEGLLDTPLALIEGGNFAADVPLLIGTNGNEGTIFRYT